MEKETEWWMIYRYLEVLHHTLSICFSPGSDVLMLPPIGVRKRFHCRNSPFIENAAPMNLQVSHHVLNKDGHQLIQGGRNLTIFG